MQCCLPTLAWEWEEERRRPGAISLEPDDGAESFDRSIEGLTESPFPGQNANQRHSIRTMILFLPFLVNAGNVGGKYPLSSIV